MLVTEVRSPARSEDESLLVRTADFDRLNVAEARALLRPCCTSVRWAAQLAWGRPYGRLRTMLVASDDVLADLRWDDLAEALAARAHTEPSLIGSDSRVYERRFGHPFLICPAGRTSAQINTALAQRLDNPVGVEREVVRVELAALVRQQLIMTFR